MFPRCNYGPRIHQRAFGRGGVANSHRPHFTVVPFVGVLPCRSAFEHRHAVTICPPWRPSVPLTIYLTFSRCRAYIFPAL